eukprot:symbB.v1.2.002435.t1/scaffold129.1/size311234/24
MGLLARSIQSFRSVSEASASDPLLRISNRLVAFFPIYSAVGYVCDLQYCRYLERRRKRLARANSCSAKLQLSVSREEAEKDEFQITLLKALAESLQVPETRLAFQGLSEGRGMVQLLAVLTRPSEDEKSTACSQLWNRLKLKLKKVEVRLSSVRSIVIDGEADEQSKVYSIWLTPTGKPAETSKKAIADLSTHFSSPSFTPHVTLGHVAGEEREVLSLLEKLARETSTFPVDFDDLRVEQTYFSGVHFPVRTSSELLHIFQSIKVKAQRGWYPTFLGGSSCRWIDSTEQFKAPLAFMKLGDLVGPVEGLDGSSRRHAASSE